MDFARSRAARGVESGDFIAWRMDGGLGLRRGRFLLRRGGVLMRHFANRVAVRLGLRADRVGFLFYGRFGLRDVGFRRRRLLGLS